MNAITPPAPARHDRSPPDMPPISARYVMQVCADRLRAIAREQSNLSVMALADAVEEAASGETDAACQALHEAAAIMRRPRA